MYELRPFQNKRTLEAVIRETLTVTILHFCCLRVALKPLKRENIVFYRFLKLYIYL